jgi:hypothetical protein
VSPLAAAVYEILHRRVRLPEPRITYRELATQLRDASDDFAHLTHRSRELYASLWEVGDECRRLELPALPALVVRADTGRPGDAYFEGSTARFKGERVAEWQRELEAVTRARYPARKRL